MARFFIDTGITALLFFPVFFLVLAVLWRLKAKGVYTLLLGFFFEIVLLFIGYAVAPQAMRYHHSAGMPPVVMGISMGCGTAMMFVVMWHLMQRQKKPETKIP